MWKLRFFQDRGLDRNRMVVLITLALCGISCAHLGMPPPPAQPCAARKACANRVAYDPAVKIIPRRLLFGFRRGDWFEISPDGRKLFHCWSDGTNTHLSVREIGKNGEHLLMEAQAVVFQPRWSRDGHSILIMANYKDSADVVLESIDVNSGKHRLLYRSNCGMPRVVAMDQRQIILAGSSCSAASRGSRFVARIDLLSGKMHKLPQPGRRWVIKWVADENMRLRAILVGGRTGRQGLMVRDDESAPWRPLRSWEKDDKVVIYGFSPDGKSLLIADNASTDTMRLYWLDTNGGGEREIFNKPGEEILGVYRLKGNPVAVWTADAHYHWHALDGALQADLDYLRNRFGGDNFNIFHPFPLGKKWLVYTGSSDQPRRVFIYQREKKKLTLLEDRTKSFSSYQLAKSVPFRIEARDGLELPCYLTLPPGKRVGRSPLVVMVHGGPESRFYDRFDPWVQMLANRGYAVIQLNFRGSWGCGKRLFLAGRDARVGGQTAEDIEDIVRWADKREEIDTSRVAVMGFSYGGYATLISLAMNPDLYACGIDGFGPSDLVRINRLFVPAGVSLEKVRKRVFDKSADRHKAEKRSPLELVERIKAPLLVAHSPGDRNVPVEHSNEIVAALRRAGKCVQYAYYPDERHGFGRPQNSIDFAGRVERFLARHLCGRAEPFSKEPGSSVEIH